MSDEIGPLHTLMLRPLTEADATPAYASWFSDPETRRWIATPTPTVDTCRDYIRTHHGEDVLLWAFEVNGQHAGNVKVERSADGSEATLGLLIAPVWRGRGVGAAAIRQAVQWCFEVWGVGRVRAGVHQFNTRSMRVFEKANFKIADLDPPRVWLHLEKTK